MVNLLLHTFAFLTFSFYHPDKPSRLGVLPTKWEPVPQRRHWLFSKVEDFLCTFVFGNEMSTLSEEVTRLHRGAAEGYPCRDCGKVYISHAWRVR